MLKQSGSDHKNDRFYGEELCLKYAEECSSFVAGDNTCIDCDREGGNLVNYTNDKEVKELL